MYEKEQLQFLLEEWEFRLTAIEVLLKDCKSDEFEKMLRWRRSELKACAEQLRMILEGKLLYD